MVLAVVREDKEQAVSCAISMQGRELAQQEAVRAKSTCSVDDALSRTDAHDGFISPASKMVPTESVLGVLAFGMSEAGSRMLLAPF